MGARCTSQRIAWACASVALASCTLDWDALDPALGSGPSSAAATSGSVGGGGGGVGAATAGVGAAGGGTTVGPGGMGGNGGTGGNCGTGGGALGALVSRGLLTRYFLDEAASGTAPTALLDAATSPLNLPIAYDGRNAFVETECHRGMSWPGVSLGGGASVAVLGTKIETGLDGSKTGTIECVFELQDADPASSRVSHIGDDDASGQFTMYSNGPMSLGFDWDDQAGVSSGEIEEWSIDLLGMGRIVAHIVLDTTRAAADSRVLLYVDGVDQGVGDIANNPMARDAETEILANGDSYAIGNREIGGRSFQGTIYYCALYSDALTATEVQQNAALLLVNDDQP